MKKNHLIVALVLIIALCAVVYSTRITPEAINGLNGEAGIIKKDGTIIRLQVRQLPFALWQVNSVEVDEGDYIYWKFWLNIKATGIAGQLTSVRFKISQSIAGALGGWYAGTEGGYSDPSTHVPTTSPTES